MFVLRCVARAGGSLGVARSRDEKGFVLAGVLPVVDAAATWNTASGECEVVQMVRSYLSPLVERAVARGVGVVGVIGSCRGLGCTRSPIFLPQVRSLSQKWHDEGGGR